MTTLFPGALWKPIPVSPSRPYRRKGRAVVFHVAVSESPSLFGLFSTSPNDSHLYVRKDGTVEQYVDLDLEAYASMAANASTISVETQGGVTNPDSEPWTDAQLQALASIARWAHDTEGVPLQVMPDSLPASRGIGWHRLGIDPWRVPGGEVWSSSRGKLCPGAAKIAQVPEIVQLADGGDVPLTKADIDMWLNYPAYTGGPSISQALKNLDQFVAPVQRGDAPGGFNPLRQEIADANTEDKAELAALAQISATLDGLKAATTTQDPNALADAVVTAMGSEFAQKVIDALGQRINQTQSPAAP